MSCALQYTYERGNPRYNRCKLSTHNYQSTITNLNNCSDISQINFPFSLFCIIYDFKQELDFGESWQLTCFTQCPHRLCGTIISMQLEVLHVQCQVSTYHADVHVICHNQTSNGSWCIGIKGEMSGTVCVTFTWDIYIYMSCLKLLFVLSFVHYCNVMVYVVYCVASGKQEKVQACLVTLWLFIISCHSLYKTTLGSLCSWKPAWSLKKRPHSMCLKPFVKMCIFVVIQIFWSLRKYREWWWWWWWWWWWSL